MSWFQRPEGWVLKPKLERPRLGRVVFHLTDPWDAIHTLKKICHWVHLRCTALVTASSLLLILLQVAHSVSHYPTVVSGDQCPDLHPQGSAPADRPSPPVQTEAYSPWASENLLRDLAL
jgi:hypothetical protein